MDSILNSRAEVADRRFERLRFAAMLDQTDFGPEVKAVVDDEHERIKRELAESEQQLKTLVDGAGDESDGGPATQQGSEG